MLYLLTLIASQKGYSVLEQQNRAIIYIYILLLDVILCLTRIKSSEYMPFLRQWVSDQFISGLQHGMARDEYKKTGKKEDSKLILTNLWN
jgi:hypothetical protein